MAATVVRDDAIYLRQEEHHLRVPVIGRQGPAVMEYDGLAAAPILVVDLRAVLGCDRAHQVLSFWIDASCCGGRVASRQFSLRERIRRRKCSPASDRGAHFQELPAG